MEVLTRLRLRRMTFLPLGMFPPRRSSPGPEWRARAAGKAGYDGCFARDEDAAVWRQFHVEHYGAPAAEKS